jgi:hypothetical protein
MREAKTKRQNVEYRMRACPQFKDCRAPVCPLETVYPNSETRFTLLGEAKCEARLNDRYRLGEGLKYHGLFKVEYSRYEQVDALGKLDLISEGRKEKIASGRGSRNDLKEEVKP